jgi:hypothetical protein
MSGPLEDPFGLRRLLTVLPENAATKSRRIGWNDREHNETDAALT